MPKILVLNITGSPIGLPLPYHAVLAPGRGGIIDDTEANVIANLGGAAAVAASFSVRPANDTEAATISPISSADIPDGAVGTADLAAGILSANAAGRAKMATGLFDQATVADKVAASAIRKTQTAQFTSAEGTGTGASQNVAHGLGVAPTSVLVALTGGPVAYAQPSIVEGAHDATNVIVTVTTGWTYKVYAWA